MKKRVPIHDIARNLNVSFTTVSFVLNAKAEEKRISSDVRKKTLDHVKLPGYKPNMVDKSLRTGKTNIIGMLVEDISDPFFSSIFRGVDNIADKHGYKIFFASTGNNTEKTKALITVFRESRIDGYIIASSPGIENEIRELMEDNAPIILFDRYLPSVTASTVVVGSFAGSYQAVRHLEKNGFSNLGFITLDSDQTQMQARLDGYVKAVQESSRPSKVQKLPYKISHDLTAEKLVQEFIQQHPELDAILFATNYLAINGLKAISNMGLKIPDDIGVVGFDDNTHFTLFNPSITAVAQPTEEITEEVLRQLLDASSDEKESKKKRTVTLPVKLIVRNSSVKGKRTEAVRTGLVAMETK